jgi:hypothetical protein
MAAKYNIDANALLNFTTDPTKMEALAAILPKVNPKPPSEPEINPDPGNTSGGGASGKRPSQEELAASTPQETAKKVASGEWSIPGW